MRCLKMSWVPRKNSAEPRYNPRVWIYSSLFPASCRSVSVKNKFDGLPTLPFGVILIIVTDWEWTSIADLAFALSVGLMVLV